MNTEKDLKESTKQALTVPVISTRTLDENDKDIYCIECGQDEQDGTYKYHRTVANGEEWYCTNCKVYHLH
jgi:predicted SprT family Zn-dependent metalloprotease